MTIICHKDDLSSVLTSLDCLQIDTEGFIFFLQRLTKSFPKFFFQYILLIFMYLVKTVAFIAGTLMLVYDSGPHFCL